MRIYLYTMYFIYIYIYIYRNVSTQSMTGGARSGAYYIRSPFVQFGKSTGFFSKEGRYSKRVYTDMCVGVASLVEFNLDCTL